ncbi:glycoprotein 5a [Wobbly possum disease virus]|uniref:Glycoprotein 5a n=1 Tax=Wobbly possum disease virus TaxID=1118369 RepID=G9FGS3_9NIDO|nr:glycoprotein 5a [Wobbly possum disease virus]AEU12353.1 glycoprotein 5a [Wobbly possum disease virus]
MQTSPWSLDTKLMLGRKMVLMLKLLRSSSHRLHPCHTSHWDLTPSRGCRCCIIITRLTIASACAYTSPRIFATRRSLR